MSQVTLSHLVLSFLICKNEGVEPHESSGPCQLHNSITHNTLSFNCFPTTWVQGSVWPHLLSDITPDPKHNVIDSYTGSGDVPENTAHKKGGNDRSSPAPGAGGSLRTGHRPLTSRRSSSRPRGAFPKGRAFLERPGPGPTRLGWQHLAPVRGS